MNFACLDNLDREPKWAYGDCCSECFAKFSLTTRKHHCRSKILILISFLI